MASGSIPVVRRSVPGSFTLNNSNQNTGAVAHSGAQFATFVITFTSLAAGSSIIAKLQECDTSGGTFVDVTGGTTAAVTVASAGDTMAIVCKTTGRQGFLRLNIANSAAFATVLENVSCILTGFPTEPINSAGTATAATLTTKFV